MRCGFGDGVTTAARFLASRAAALSASRPQQANPRPAPGAALAQQLADGQLLVRDYIQDSLYNPVYGYFSTPLRLIFAPRIDFQQLRHHADYQRALAAAYAQADESPLHIVEIGGGTGTCARNVLDYFRRRRPQIYASMRYTIVEISASLAARQRGRFREDEPIEIVQQSVFDLGRIVRKHPCVFIALEVLDNLPHDKLVWRDGQWHETRLRLREGCNQADFIAGIRRHPASQFISETLQPIRDPFIADTLARHMAAHDAAQQHRGLTLLRLVTAWQQWRRPADGQILWLPTGAMQLLQALYRHAPAHRLLLADFDMVKEAIAGRQAPAVMRGGLCRYEDYLAAPLGLSDMVFPTDFAALAAVYAQMQPRSHVATTTKSRSGGSSSSSSGSGSTDGGRFPLSRAAATARAAEQPRQPMARVCSTADFMSVFADVRATETKDGYNPLLLDYANTQMFLGTSCP